VALADGVPPIPQLKKDGKAFEIVFVSSDRKEDQFTEYYNEQPWLALPYADRDTKAKLSKKYKVRNSTLVGADKRRSSTSRSPPTPTSLACGVRLCP